MSSTAIVRASRCGHRAAASAAVVASLGRWVPASSARTVRSLTPARAASPACVGPAARRAAHTVVPNRERTSRRSSGPTSPHRVARVGAGAAALSVSTRAGVTTGSLVSSSASTSDPTRNRPDDNPERSTEPRPPERRRATCHTPGQNHRFAGRTRPATITNGQGAEVPG